ncbi:hypothetical protein ACFVAD_20575 [Sutcliffiella sp. NPDC057660]|uniref:hypothetical protein n=1 Tax=Sutcliffiella sp. NPDC057660 TaxID=3346199 RepID=UPI0036BE75AF
MALENKKLKQKKIQGLYRKVKQQKTEDTKTSKKEAIMVVVIVFLFIVLNAIFKAF